MWATPHRKNCRPAHLCLAVTAVSTASTSRRPWPPCLCAHIQTPTMRLLRHPMSRQTAPQMATRNESPHDHPGRAPFLWTRPGPLTFPAPSQRAAAIPHASHTPFMCPNPSHDLTHAPSTRRDAFRCAPPLLHRHPLACPFTLSLTGYVPTLYHATYAH